MTYHLENWGDLMTAIFAGRRSAMPKVPTQLVQEMAFNMASNAFFRPKTTEQFDVNVFRTPLGILVRHGIDARGARVWFEVLSETGAASPKDLRQLETWVDLYERGEFALFPEEVIAYDANGDLIDYGRFSRADVLRAFNVKEMKQ